MPKSIIGALHKIEPVDAFLYGGAKAKRCAWCKKKFEILSAQWKYKTRRNGRDLWFCRYNCWRAEENHVNPQPVLRGERVYEARLNEGKEKPI